MKAQVEDGRAGRQISPDLPEAVDVATCGPGEGNGRRFSGLRIHCALVRTARRCGRVGVCRRASRDQDSARERLGSEAGRKRPVVVDGKLAPAGRDAYFEQPQRLMDVLSAPPVSPPKQVPPISPGRGLEGCARDAAASPIADAGRWTRGSERSDTRPVTPDVGAPRSMTAHLRDPGRDGHRRETHGDQETRRTALVGRTDGERCGRVCGCRGRCGACGVYRNRGNGRRSAGVRELTRPPSERCAMARAGPKKVLATEGGAGD